MGQPAITCQGCKLALVKCAETAFHGTCGGYVHVITNLHRCPYGGGIATPVLRLVHWCREPCPLCQWMAELSPGQVTVCDQR